MSTRDAIEAERQRRAAAGRAFADTLHNAGMVELANLGIGSTGGRYIYHLNALGYDVTRKEPGNDTRNDTSGIREPEEIPGDRRGEGRHP